MNKTNQRALFVIAGLVIAVSLFLFLHAGDLKLLNPKGLIADKQRSLIVFTVLLSLVVVIPVFILTFTIAWKYRAANVAARYTPDWDHNTKLEVVWWGIPCAIILILGVVTWTSSHELDPYRPLQSSVLPVRIQVVALPWKWLFIYPDQQIATVNYIRFPAGTPVDFQITADAPMNSFWIPELGGQIYAMPGMSTQLHLMATSNGVYGGSSANLSGRGFAGMRFNAEATSQADFDRWVASVQQSPNRLDGGAYAALARPSQNNPAAVYASAEQNLYDKVLTKYMAPGRAGTGYQAENQ